MPNHFWKLPAVPCFILALALSAGAEAASLSGTVIAVVQSTEAAGDSGSRMLVTAGPVYMGDTIRTGARGEAQIRLSDNTRLVVGPNSSMVVDAFILGAGGTAREVSLNAVRGAFRFITGQSRKSAYRITTPTATIGVRGTEFDFSVDRGGGLNFALFSGEARICGRSGRCTVLSGACSVAVVPRTGAVQQLAAGDARTALLRSKFPYVAAQTRLNRAFRVDTSSCSVRRADILPGDRVTPTVFGRRASIVAPPDQTEVPIETGSIRNHNGFADGSNPGRGSDNNNASGGGTNNPGGGGGSGGGNGGGGNNGGGNGNGNSNRPNG